MRVRLSKRADAQIATALVYVASQSPKGAAHIRQKLNELLELLAENPRLGKFTDEAGVHRLVVSPYPYLIDYHVLDNEIVVLRFRHAARRS